MDKKKLSSQNTDEAHALTPSQKGAIKPERKDDEREAHRHHQYRAEVVEVDV